MVVANPFHTSQLLKSLSNYPVTKGGEGSGRYPKGSGGNHKVTERAEMVRIDTDIAEKYYEFREAENISDSKADSFISYFLPRANYVESKFGGYRYKGIPELDGKKITVESAKQLIDSGQVEIDAYKKGSLESTYEKCLTAQKETDEKEAAYEEANSRYEGWNRFYGVVGGHIHSSMTCHSCNKGERPTEFVWLPQLSGSSSDEAVAEQGATLCTHCFPDAPVEQTTGTWTPRAPRVEGEIRSRDELIGADLRNADLSGQRAQKVNFSEADFSGANMKGASFTQALMENAKFDNADLTKANLSKSDLTEASLVNANLGGAKLEGSNLLGADLSGANISRFKVDSETIFDQTYFSGATTKVGKSNPETNVGYSTFTNCDFTGADLGGFTSSGVTRFSNCDFTDTNLAAQMEKDYDGNLTPKSSWSNFEIMANNCNFTNAVLTNRIFEGSMVDCDFTNADLSGLQGHIQVFYTGRGQDRVRTELPLDFSGSDFTGAKIDGADLRLADLSGAKNLDKVVGEPAKWEASIFVRTDDPRIGQYKLPDGYDWSPTKGIFQK